MSDPSRVRGTGLVCWALGLVAVHTGVVTLHAAAHLAIPVAIASPLDGALILGAFYAGPVLGALCLYAGRGPAPTILAGSFLVGLAYGVTSHFAVSGPDNIASVASGGWGAVFMITSAALSALEGIGLALAVALWRAPARTQGAAAPAA